jgi:hypothetical protein
MKITSRLQCRGLTLIEMTVAMGVGMTIAVMMLALVNQQVAFLRIFSAQSFLTDEAPMVGMYVGKMAGKADRFRLHASLEDALAGRDPQLVESKFMVMNFRQPDGTVRASILAVETQGDRDILNYYLVPAVGAVATPQWSITKRAARIRFSVEEGILRMRLTGPADEQITYSGTMQQ